jgi:hypothetical protein
MRYLVPQFIGREAKIVGPLTFKQFIFVGGAGALIFFLYFTLAGKNFLLFLLLSLLLIGMGMSLAFLKISGIPLTSYLEYFLSFLVSSKTYIWQKGGAASRAIIQKEEKEKKEVEEIKRPEIKRPSLPISQKSRLEKLSSKIRTRRL